MNRNQFLKLISLGLISVSFKPIFSTSEDKFDNYIIDLHAHPPLKYKLFSWSMFKKNIHSKTFGGNAINLQSNIMEMKMGNIKGIVSNHMIPEREVKKWKLQKRLGRLPYVSKLVKNFREKVESEDVFTDSVNSIVSFEKHINKHNGKALIVKNKQELEQALSNDIPFYLHALEGAHHLGRNLSVEQYKKNIDKFYELGVRVITLGHFYSNDIVATVEGIPPSAKKLIGDPSQAKEHVKALSDKAKDIIQYLWDNKILIDLTHTHPSHRKEIFELNKTSLNPLSFTHVGVRHNFEYNDKDIMFAAMCPTDEEIINIKNCNGVIGVIFYNYWLCGEEHPEEDLGYNNIIETIKHIYKVTGTWNHVAIGTDFDGMTDPPNDYYRYSQFKEFGERLHKDLLKVGASTADVENVLHGNVLRLLIGNL